MARERIPNSLGLAVSPYHLTTRELTAAVAFAFAGRAITIVPEPAEGVGREQVRMSIERVPRLLRVLESWRWAGPLWRAGLVAGRADGVAAFGTMAEADARVATDESLARLGNGAGAMPGGAGDAADRWLDALCSDLLRGGPDPRMTTVVTSALDQFAVMHGLVAVRGSTESIAQRAELRMLKRVFSIAVPVMSRSAGGRILELRASLNAELEEMRRAMLDLWSAGGTAEASVLARLHNAVDAYSAAFDRWFARTARDDEASQRTMRAYVNLTGGLLPTSCAILSARAAIRSAGRGAAMRSAHAVSVTAGADLRVLLIRPMNVAPVGPRSLNHGP